MKLEKIEHNHKLTNILKVGLFAILMCMPFIASLSKMAYVACNKNAYESYYGKTINQTEYTPITAIGDNLLNERIYFDIKHPSILRTSGWGGDSYYLYFDNLEIISTNYDLPFDTYVGMSFYVGSDDTKYNIWFVDSNGVRSSSLNASGNLIITFEYTSNNLYTLEKQYLIEDEAFKSMSFNKYSYLDNVFYYANNQVWEEDIFSWVNNGLFANSLGAFVAIFGIAQNSYFNNLLTYWLVLIIIYIIIDLILGLFTLITHIISNRKVKE